MYGMLKTSQWCHVSHVCNAAMVSCLPCCHVSDYVMQSITMNDRCLVGCMVTDDSILFMAIHMMEVLRAVTSSHRDVLFGGGGEEAGLIGPVEVPLATPSMGGALTCCLGVSAFLDCFGGVIKLAAQLLLG